MRQITHPDAFSFSIYEAMDGSGDTMTIYVAGDFKIPLKSKISGRIWRHINPGTGIYNPDYIPKEGAYAWRPLNNDEIKQIQEIQIERMDKESLHNRGRKLNFMERQKVKARSKAQLKGQATVVQIGAKLGDDE
jgi:hypothetical protein